MSLFMKVRNCPKDDFWIWKQSYYRKSLSRSRPCIILDSKFHRFVLDVLWKVQLLEQTFFTKVTEGPFKTQKMPKNMNFMFYRGSSSNL